MTKLDWAKSDMYWSSKVGEQVVSSHFIRTIHGLNKSTKMDNHIRLEFQTTMFTNFDTQL